MKIFNLKKDAKKGFKLLAGINRPIIPNQVTKLSKSILMMGCIRPVVVAQLPFIDDTDDKYIIDGQHLYHALIRNNLDIPYIEVSINDKVTLVETIALLNASSKSWKIEDYLTAWSHLRESYRSLRNYFNIYDFDLSVLASILSGGNGDTGGQINKKLKNGTFEIIDEKKNVEILDRLTDVLNIVPRHGRYENKYLCTEYISFLKSKGCSYNHKTFLTKLSKKKLDFVLATQEQGKLENLFQKL